MAALVFWGALGLPQANLIAIVIFCFCLYKGGFKITCDSSMIYVALFAVSYVGFLALNGNSRLMFVVHPIAYYLSGVLLVNCLKDKKRGWMRYIWIVSFGLFIHVLLTFLYNGISSSRYTIVDIWTKALWNPTGISCCLSLSVALPMLAWKGQIAKSFRIVLWIQFIVALLLGLWLGSRTLLVIMAATFAIDTLIVMKENIKEMLGIFTVCALLLSLGLIAYKTNFAGFATKLGGTNLFTRYAIEDLVRSDNRRFDALYEGITGLWQYPFGGNTELHYAHNLWLDVGKQAGIFPVLFLLLFFASMAERIIVYSRKNPQDINFKCLAISVFIAFTLNCMVEPIMNGMEHQFLTFIFVMGMTSAYTRKTRLCKQFII